MSRNEERKETRRIKKINANRRKYILLLSGINDTYWSLLPKEYRYVLRKSSRCIAGTSNKLFKEWPLSKDLNDLLRSFRHTTEQQRYPNVARTLFVKSCEAYRVSNLNDIFSITMRALVN